MSAFDSSDTSWLRVVARRLCGGRSPEEWQAEAERLSLQRRQQIAERENEVQAARELLTLLVCPYWQRVVEEEGCRQLLQGDNAATESSFSASPSPDIPTPIQRFEELLNEDISVRKLRARPYVFDGKRNPIRLALWQALWDCSVVLLVDWDREMYDEYSEWGRLHLGCAMNELRLRTEREYETVLAAHRDYYDVIFRSDWQSHVIAEAIRECERLGVRIFECTSGSSTELL